MTDTCPCGSGRDYPACCGPVIEGSGPAATAEALMRSRYSAFARGAIDHLEHSLHPDARADHDAEATRRWADKAEWQGLTIVATTGGGPDDDAGTVEFIASYRQKGVTHAHHEVGAFHRHQGRWYYTDGRMVTPGTQRNEGPRVGRNEPCPCGSGRKYKKCCGAA
ncbi:MAG: YchJ family protein [Gammaproteobacteria bacterium]|nr:YchJ family protein [Gammaproteobacteria bacterium]